LLIGEFRPDGKFFFIERLIAGLNKFNRRAIYDNVQDLKTKTCPFVNLPEKPANTSRPIYGLMLTAWGFASAFGPLLIASMRQASGVYRGGLHVVAGVMAASTLLPIIISPPSKLVPAIPPQRVGRDDRGQVAGATRPPAA
jgi:hypothetical protein